MIRRREKTPERLSKTERRLCVHDCVVAGERRRLKEDKMDKTGIVILEFVSLPPLLALNVLSVSSQ
jgi:hypothetical protein